MMQEFFTSKKQTLIIFNNSRIPEEWMLLKEPGYDAAFIDMHGNALI